jgi:hypothetical protein
MDPVSNLMGSFINLWGDQHIDICPECGIAIEQINWQQILRQAVMKHKKSEVKD